MPLSLVKTERSGIFLIIYSLIKAEYSRVFYEVVYRLCFRAF